MLAAELALAGVDVAIVELRESQALVGSRARGLHARRIEVLDQRGVADRFVSQGTRYPAVSFARVPLDISGLPSRHNYLLGLSQSRFEEILAGWVAEGAVPIHRGRDPGRRWSVSSAASPLPSNSNIVRTERGVFVASSVPRRTRPGEYGEQASGSAAIRTREAEIRTVPESRIFGASRLSSEGGGSNKRSDASRGAPHA